MTLMKRVVLLLLTGVVALAVAACGSDDSSGDAEATTEATTEKAVAQEGGPDAGEIVFAHSASIPQVVKLPQTLAVEAMEKIGYSTKQEYMQTTTDSINAVLRGTATFGNTAPANFFSAVAEGADIVAIAGGGSPDFVMLGTSEIDTICDAKKLAINNPVSTTDALVKTELADCGGVRDREILTIALTPNRINAMNGGQVDATPVQLVSVPLVEREYADSIKVLENLAKKYPEIISTLTFVKRSTLEERPQALLDFVAAQQQVIEDIYDDPNVLVEATKRIVDSVSPEDAEPAAQLYVDAKVFPLDGGLNAEHLAATIAQLEEAGTIEGGVDPEEYVDRRFIDEVIGASDAEADE